MLPVLVGVIARRTLVNFAVDPEIARRLVPPQLEVVLRNGRAIAGVCLIRLEHLRPKGMPSAFGLASENMAHRIAIRFETADGMQDGVFIWRRDTDNNFVVALGGRVFPGPHGHAEFAVNDNDGELDYDIRSEDGVADVLLRATPGTEWTSSPAFNSFDDIQEFFRRADCGFSCALRSDRLEGMQMKSLVWNMSPLNVRDVRSTFYDSTDRFPSGSAVFDSAVVMRAIPHEWHELDSVPELAGAR